MFFVYEIIDGHKHIKYSGLECEIYKPWHRIQGSGVMIQPNAHSAGVMSNETTQCT